MLIFSFMAAALGAATLWPATFVLVAATVALLALCVASEVQRVHSARRRPA